MRELTSKDYAKLGLKYAGMAVVGALVAPIGIAILLSPAVFFVAAALGVYVLFKMFSRSPNA